MDVTDNIREQIIDEEHLRLLSIGHYVAGAMHIAFASIFIFHFVFMVVAASNPEMFAPNHQAQNRPPDALFHVFAWVLGSIILAGWTFGGLTIYVGRCIKARTHRTLSLVMAGLNTLAIPVGTVLGVSSLIVLTRSSIKKLYRLQYSAGPRSNDHTQGQGNP